MVWQKNVDRCISGSLDLLFEADKQRFMFLVIGYQLLVISYQLSVISYQGGNGAFQPAPGAL